MPQQIEMPVQTRSASFVPGSVDSEARTVEMVWSTGAAVRRRNWSGQQYDEVLSLDPAHVRLERLNGGAPLLNSHNMWNVSGMLGVVEKAWIDKGEGRAIVRFSKRDAIEPVFQDVVDGILRNVSVGYAVHKFEVDEKSGPVPIWRAVDWEPVELSAVPVGADPGAGFRSEASATTTSCQLITIRGEHSMPQATPQTEKPTDSTATRQATPQDEVTAKPSDSSQQTRSPTPEEAEALSRSAVAAERQRTMGIYDAQEKLGVVRAAADKLVQDGVPLDDARKRLIDEAARNAPNIRNHLPAMPGEQDERTTRNAAVESALLHRFDPTAHKLSDAARDWSGMTLMELSRAFLEAGGYRARNISRNEVAARALHTDSDFPGVLANVAHKTLRDAYSTAPRTFQPFCRRMTASDFKAMYRVQLGEAPALEKINEGGEYRRGSLGENQEAYRVETWGKIIAISRQVIINDDLNAFTRIPQLFGVAAANLESDVVWGIITANPNMGDGAALFHANHKNLAATGTAISVANLGVARKTMGLQTGVDGKTVINVRPAFLIVPAALEVTAEQLLAINMTPAKSSDVVPQSMRTLVVIPEPRLDTNSATAWYLAANPNQIDTIEYAYLEGNDGVYIETRTGFEVDGVEIKARLDFGAKAIDWRGFYKNPGA